MPNFRDDGRWTVVNYRRGRQVHRSNNPPKRRDFSRSGGHRSGERHARFHASQRRSPVRVRPPRSYADAVSGRNRSASPVYRGNFNRDNNYVRDNFHYRKDNQRYNDDGDNRRGRKTDRRGRDDYNRGSGGVRAAPHDSRNRQYRRRGEDPSADSTSRRRYYGGSSRSGDRGRHRPVSRGDGRRPSHSGTRNQPARRRGSVSRGDGRRPSHSGARDQPARSTDGRQRAPDDRRQGDRGSRSPSPTRQPPPPPPSRPDVDQRAGVRQDRNDGSFREKVKTLHRLIKSLHHMKNVGDFKNPPRNITKMSQYLSAFIKPAYLNDHTSMLLDGNSKNWAHNACMIMKDHYLECVEQELLSIELIDWQDLKDPFDVAVLWSRRNLGRRLRQTTVDHAKELIKARLNAAGPPGTMVADTPPDRQPIRTVPIDTQIEVLSDPSPPAARRPPPAGHPPAETPAEAAVATAVSSASCAAELKAPPAGDRRDEDFIPSTPLLTEVVRTPLVRFDVDPVRGPSSPVDLGPPPLHSSPSPAPGRAADSPSSVLDMSLDEINALIDKCSNPNPVQVCETPKEQRQPSLVPMRITRSSVSQARDSHRPAEASSDPPAPPHSALDVCKPFRHRNTDNKVQDWRFEVKGQFVILGDSNISRIPEVNHPGLQMDSFPGATFHHASALLSQPPSDGKVKVVILSFGINSKSVDPHAGPILDLEEALEKAGLVFPRAKIMVPLINYSDALSAQERDNLEAFNSYVRQYCPCIPTLPAHLFSTNADRVHWSSRTAKCMIDHWLQFLKN